MLTRATGLVRAIPRMSSLNLTRSMGGATPANWKSDIEIDRENKTSMEFMPVPQGSWKEHYNRRNNKWNMMVAASSLFFGVTLFAAYKFDCFYFHGEPDYKSIKIEEY